MKRPSRFVLLSAVVAIAAGLIAINIRRDATAPDTRLVWVATAHQFGPVSYRDPAGAISPDGRWVAYSEGRFLRIRPIAGGPSVDFAGAAQIRSLVWSPDSRTVLANGYRSGPSWALYDRNNRTATSFNAGIRQPSWSRTGSIAAIGTGDKGDELWILSPDGRILRRQRVTMPISYPAWTSSDEIGCVAMLARGPRLTVPCGGTTLTTTPDMDVYGPIAFTKNEVFFASPSRGGTVDLWQAPVGGGRARPLTRFSGDTYSPSVSDDGRLLFKVQSYRTFVAAAPSAGGSTTAVALFQSETPSWRPDSGALGVTFGSWRRVIDDAHYPDIAQDVAIVPFDPSKPADAPSSIVQASPSEDQSLCWSPNRRWIAFHSHKDRSDDIWLRPAGADGPPRRLSYLGRGAETGWPRWSPDGGSLSFVGGSVRTHRQAIHVVGIDQETGRVTAEPHEVSISRIDGELIHAEWLPDSEHFVGIAKEAPGRHVIFVVAKDGGEARVVHRVASEHDEPGLAASPDGREVAFIGPAPDGFFQVFALPIAGGEPRQVTTDPSNKTQPAWSPDGRWIAFTVWSYDAQFWMIPSRP